MRANGEGSVYQRADGRWVAAISLPGGKRKYFYGKTEAEALEHKRDAERALDRGADFLQSDPKLGDFLTMWLDEVAAHKLRPRTADSYRMHVALHISPAIGAIRLSKLAAPDVQRFVNGLQRKGLSPRSIQYSRAVLRIALNQALKWNMVQRNVATLVEVPRSKGKPELHVSDEQMRAIFDAVRGHRLEALFVTAGLIAARLSELLALTWTDVDERSQTLSITKSVQKIHGEYQVQEVKTTRSRRKLPVPDELMAVLTAHRDRQAMERAAFPQTETPWNLIFCTRHGTPLDGPNVTHQFQKLLARADLPKLRVHDLRHAGLSLMVAQGEDVVTVSQIAGHSLVSTTLNVYSHAVPGMSRAALNKLAARLVGDSSD